MVKAITLKYYNDSQESSIAYSVYEHLLPRRTSCFTKGITFFLLEISKLLMGNLLTKIQRLPGGLLQPIN